MAPSKLHVDQRCRRLVHASVLRTPKNSRVMRGIYIPAFENQVLATVRSAARARTRIEENFIFVQVCIEVICSQLATC